MTAPDSQTPPPTPLKTLLARGWRKKCPQCGQGPLYVRWLKLHETCPVCGLRYLPNQGDLLGPLVFIDRALFLIPFITLFYFRVWHPNMIIFAFVAAAMVFALVFTMPNRNGMSLALDYHLRRGSGEFEKKEPPREKGN